MKVKDSVKLSVNSILHRRLRAWLTLLGIIIGVAAVVSIVSIGNGAQASVNERLSGFGADIITMTTGFNRAGSFGGAARGEIDIPSLGGGGGGQCGGVRTTSSNTKTPVLTSQDVAIISGNPDVLAVNQIVSGRSSLVFGSQTINTSIQGINPNTWIKTTNITLASGRLLGASDSRSAVIGYNLANTSFKTPITLGRKIDINGVAFTIVGTLQKSGSGFGGGGSDSTVYVTYTAAWDVVDVNRNNYSSIQIKVKDASLATIDVNVLTQSLLLSRKVTGGRQDFTLTSTEAIQQQIQSVTQTLTLFLGAIAAVSLLVGAVGIANSMFTSVLEKTREIGFWINWRDNWSNYCFHFN
ncbi:MAG: ABC transporter permease [Candidatus Diapherotrites archaeon]|nr:ABC transporter permease [Candidatus Diapherotrites archaeon]